MSSGGGRRATGRRVARATPPSNANRIPGRGVVPSIDELYRLAGVRVGVHEGRTEGCDAHRAAFRRLVRDTCPVWRSRVHGSGSA